MRHVILCYRFMGNEVLYHNPHSSLYVAPSLRHQSGNLSIEGTRRRE